jgi:hypothetical protein
MHQFGSVEVQKMFIEDATSDTFRRIADDMDHAKAKNYIDLKEKEPNILQRHFKYARERLREITRHI